MNTNDTAAVPNAGLNNFPHYQGGWNIFEYTVFFKNVDHDDFTVPFPH